MKLHFCLQIPLHPTHLSFRGKQTLQMLIHLFYFSWHELRRYVFCSFSHWLNSPHKPISVQSLTTSVSATPPHHLTLPHSCTLTYYWSENSFPSLSQPIPAWAELPSFFLSLIQMLTLCSRPFAISDMTRVALAQIVPDDRSSKLAAKPHVIL